MQNGDKEGVSLAYRHYSDALYGMIFRVVQSREAAEEVLQDTFVKIWKYAPQYDASKGRLFTWFANIARNAAIDKLRSATYRKGQKTEQFDNLVNSEKLGSETNQLVDSGLRTIIDSLDEKYRKLIDLVYFQGYSQREIEKEFSIPLGTVKTRLRTALKELRRILDQDYKDKLLTIILFLETFYYLL